MDFSKKMRSHQFSEFRHLTRVSPEIALSCFVIVLLTRFKEAGGKKALEEVKKSIKAAYKSQDAQQTFSVLDDHAELKFLKDPDSMSKEFSANYASAETQFKEKTRVFHKWFESVFTTESWKFCNRQLAGKELIQSIQGIQVESMSPDSHAEEFIQNWLRPRISPELWLKCFPSKSPFLRGYSVTQAARQHPLGSLSLGAAILAIFGRSILRCLEGTVSSRRRYILERKKLELLEQEVRHYFTCWIVQEDLKPLTGKLEEIVAMS
jgi:hypothetical protein